MTTPLRCLQRHDVGSLAIWGAALPSEPAKLEGSVRC